MNEDKAMVPQVFLSLSGSDEKFAKQVFDALPHGLARIYHHAFETGSDLLDEMEKGVARSSIIILLASKTSLASHWVKFELDQARLQRIQKKCEVLAFPIEAGISFSEYPEWMRNTWIASHVLNPRDIGRTVTEKLFSQNYQGPGAFRDVIGRGNLLDKTRRQFMQVAAKEKETPNVLMFTGTTQIGRRTFARQAVDSLYPAKPTLTNGPHLELPQFADIADIYRGLLDNVMFDASSEDIERNIEAFLELEGSEQVDQVVALLSYFSDRDLAVFLYTGGGFFNEDGSTKSWFWTLIDKLSDYPSIVLILISNRRLREHDLIGHWNILQMHIPALEDADIDTLTAALAPSYGIKPFTFSKEISRAIGGHPGVTKSAVRLVANDGLDLIEKQPHSVFTAQTYILSHNIDDENLDPVQRQILFVLSWLPSLRADLLTKTISQMSVEDERIVEAIEELLLSCLIVINDDDYAISKELREIFRRRYGYGDDALLEQLGKTLSAEFEDAQRRGIFNANLVDAVVFMHAIGGRAIPEGLRKIVLPSKFAEILRIQYNQGREDKNILSQLSEWGETILTMRLDDNVREEVLAILAQANVRLRNYDVADYYIAEMERLGFRSAAFIKGFRLRREGKIEEAIPVLRQAIHSRKSLRYSVQELATVFNRLGRDKDLEDLLDEHRSVVSDSVVLLDFEIGRLISLNNIDDASKRIKDLEALPENDGRSVVRQAQIESQRWGRHDVAFNMVNELVLGGVGDQVRTRRWRAMFAIYSGEIAIASRDIEWLKSRNGQEDIVERLMVHKAIAASQGELAEKLSGKLDLKIKQNRILRARALEKLLDTKPMGVADKKSVKDVMRELYASAGGAIFDV